MAGSSNLTPEQRTEIVLALLRREEPVSILARRYGVSSKTLTQWKNDLSPLALLVWLLENAKRVTLQSDWLILNRQWRSEIGLSAS